MAKSSKSTASISTNATGAGLDEPNFKRVGSVKLSEGGKAVNLHFFEGDRYFSIPITDIKLIMFEAKEGKSDTIGVIREYPNKIREP
jgi:hypothetical protein